MVKMSLIGEIYSVHLKGKETRILVKSGMVDSTDFGELLGKKVRISVEILEPGLFDDKQGGIGERKKDG